MSTQYFAEQPQSAHRPGVVHVVLPDLHLALRTDSGVFSPARIDPGTRLLLEEAPPPPADGDLLDLGCGYGPVACVLASRAPQATVWAVDVNERARDLTARNARHASLANVRTAPPDDPAVPGALAAIWSNPPIRVGKAALHGMLRRWLARLRPGGQACLVVGRNLGADSLHSWLEEDGWPAARIAARAGYRLLLVTNDPERTRQISHDTDLP